MVIVKPEISEEYLINFRTEEDDFTQQEATSKDQLSNRLTSSGYTPNPPSSKATLDKNIIIEAASPDATSIVTFTLESSVKPTIKQETLCSIARENLRALPLAPQEHQDNVAARVIEEQSIYSGEGASIGNCTGADVIRPADDEKNKSSKLLRDSPEQLNRLVVSNKEKLDHEGWKLEKINLNKDSQSPPSPKENKDCTGSDVAEKSNEDMEIKDDKFRLRTSTLQNHALQDHHMMLMLGEQQNKRRLWMARMEMNKGDRSSKRVEMESMD
ncbi:hypothetical protein MFRU_061g00080 [Monilinia fructicola]|nr:hypothetical protein MFRU_061g00080 [Monilinia fructicola]